VVCPPFCDAKNRLIQVQAIDPLAAACETTAPFTTGGAAEWFAQTDDYTTDWDAVQSGDIDDDETTWIEMTVEGSGTVTFDYKLSAESGDSFSFYIDESYTFGRSGSKSWTESGPWTVSGSETHTLRWQFSKDDSGSSGDDCAWVDNIRWTGDVPESGGDWAQIQYTYDPSGRRIEKDVDGEVTKYLYDGSHCIAEYDANDTLLRTYIYGPGVDQPICMTETTGSYADTYYYHFDALGSVVALSDSDGDTVQVYEYDVYGQVAASDPNHPNPFLFTGRRYDTETGLYYYRARYYNASIGRFLQTDPIGYGDGMNMYAYCANNSVNSIDPSGCVQYVDAEQDPDNPCSVCGGERSDHYGGVYLDPPPTRKAYINDFWGIKNREAQKYWEYYEWTGGFKIVNYRMNAQRVAAAGTVRWSSRGITISGLASNIANTIPAAASGNVAALVGISITQVYSIVWGCVESKIMEHLTSQLDGRVQGNTALRAYIEVYVFRRPHGWWEEFWTIGTWRREKKWVEVKCGDGYNVLGMEAYDSRQHAVDAIGAALSGLPVRTDAARRR